MFARLVERKSPLLGGNNGEIRGFRWINKTLNDIDMLICMICIGYIKKTQGVSQRPERKKKTEL